jgi:CheY-like chemotaxis protein
MPRILIVDDEAACRLPLARLLQLEGYEIAQAADGLEALQRLGEAQCDLVLLDLLMPGMDGITFIERARADARFATLPIFLVTAVHDSKMLLRARSFGIQQYLFKGDVPFMRMLELIKTQLGEEYTPVRRGRRPKNPEAQQPKQVTNLATDPFPDSAKNDSEGNYDFEDDSADIEYLRD